MLRATPIGRVLAALPLVLLPACISPSSPVRVLEEGPPEPDTVRVAVLYVYAERGPRDSREEADRTLRANFTHISRLVRMAAAAGAQVIVTPEYGNVGGWVPHASYPLLSTVIPELPTKDPLWLRTPDGVATVLVDYARLAFETNAYLVVHYLEREPAGDEERYYPVAIAFDPQGRMIARYRKRVLWLLTETDKSSGSEAVSFDTPYGRFGLLLCSDVLGPATWLELTNTHDVDYFICQSRWAYAPLTGRMAMNMVADLTGRAVIWSNQHQDGLAGGAGVIRPWGSDTVIGLGGEPGVVVANLPLPDRLRTTSQVAEQPR